MFLLTCDSCWFCFPLPPLSLSKCAECCWYSLLPHPILFLAGANSTFIPASDEGSEWDVLLAKAGAQGGLLVTTVSRVLAGCKWCFCVCEGGLCFTCP